MGSLWCPASAFEFKRIDDVAPRMRPFSPRLFADLAVPNAPASSHRLREHFLREVRELAGSAQ
jgi:hypothetical protein